MNEFAKSRKLLELASGSHVSVVNLYKQDEQNRKKHKNFCKKTKHLHCECLFCDKTYLVGIF